MSFDGSTIVKINNPKLKALLEEAEKDGLCIEPFMENSKYDFSVECYDYSIVDGCPTDLDDLKEYILQLIEAINEDDYYKAYCRFEKVFEAEYPNLKDSFTYVSWNYSPDDETRAFEHQDDMEFKYGKPGRKKVSNKKKNGPSTLKEIFPGIDMTKPSGLVIDDDGCCTGYDRKQHAEFLGEENCLFITKDVKTIEDEEDEIFDLLTMYDKCVVTSDLEDFGEYYNCGGFSLFYIIDADTNKVVYSSEKDVFCSNCYGLSLSLSLEEEEDDYFNEVLCKYTKAYQAEEPSKTSTKTIGEFTIDDTTGRLTGYKGKETDIVLPNGIKIIGQEAFDSKITSVVIPEGVETIDAEAFSYCDNLKSVTIPNTIKKIGESAFDYCIQLTSIVIPEGVEAIEAHAFTDCKNLKSVTLPNTIKKIGESAFRNCEQLTSIVIPEGVEMIDADAFYCCRNLKSVTLPKTIKKIDKNAFYGCEQIDIVIPKGCIDNDARAEDLEKDLQV